MVHVLPMAVF